MLNRSLALAQIIQAPLSFIFKDLFSVYFSLSLLPTNLGPYKIYKLKIEVEKLAGKSVSGTDESRSACLGRLGLVFRVQKGPGFLWLGGLASTERLLFSLKRDGVVGPSDCLTHRVDMCVNSELGGQYIV